MGSNTSNSTVVSVTTQRINAIQKHITNGRTEIPIGGAMVKLTDAVSDMQAGLDAREAVTSTQGAYRAALVSRATADARRRIVDDALKSYVLNRFGADSQAAHDCGYAPPKTAEKDVATKAKAILLNKATREARGTKGPKAKLRIKGTLAPAASSTEAAVAPAVVVSPAPVVTAVPAATSSVVPTTPVVGAPVAAPSAPVVVAPGH